MPWILPSLRSWLAGLCSALCLLLLSYGPALAQQPAKHFPAAGTPVAPQVDIRWDRYYDTEALVTLCQEIAATYPELAKYQSIGTSYQGRPIPALTITDFNTERKPANKPGFYVDGNVHANEIQAAEVALYMAWYLTESFDSVERIKKLLQDQVFYILPTINPDGRHHYMREANNMHSPRSGLIPLDDDRDGKVNEDGYDDLNGDGHITMMRRKSPTGRMKPAEEDDRRMQQAGPDEAGTYEMLGFEGIDNDGDGQINEDGPGYYDPNRDWGWSWQPNHTQRGAYKYPFSLPETRAVARFVRARPNIAGALSYHNTGGMLLRGPGNKADKATYQRQDVQIYDQLGKVGEELLPGYDYMTTYKDLYSVYGGETDWLFGARGIFAFTGELWSSYQMYHEESESYFGKPENQYQFDRQLLFEAAFVDWEAYNHPTYGEVKIGGFKKHFTRDTPGFMLQEEAHRNLAFAVYFAEQTPRLEVLNKRVDSLGPSLYALELEVANRGMIPTRAYHDRQHELTRPDIATLKGPGVLTGLQKPLNEVADADLTADRNAQRLQVSHVPGNSSVRITWLVGGLGQYSFTYDSAKGGIVRANFEL